MSIFFVILIGLVVGIVAKFFMPGDDPGGLIVTTLLGMGGALVASYLGQSFGLYPQGESAGFVAAVFGAMLLLLIYRLFRTGKGHSARPHI